MKTKIYGTLGPACCKAGILEKMLEEGMTGVRLNLSHVSLPQAEDQVMALKQACSSTGLQADLLVDMQGPELRIGALPTPVELKEGETVTLGERGIPLPIGVLNALTVGQELLLDDGKLLLRTVSCVSEYRAEVLRGGMLRSRKSVAVPGLSLELPALTETDKTNLSLARQYGVTGVMQPFVRGPQDLRELRSELNHSGGESIRIFAKIESREGMNALDRLIPETDEIVIARGDLGNAMPLWELPEAQDRIAARCRNAMKPYMVVTQMLASMEQSPVPTRAEVSDIFYAVLLGASSVMVTGETAVGKYPVETIRYLAKTARQAEQYREQI